MRQEPIFPQNGLSGFWPLFCYSLTQEDRCGFHNTIACILFGKLDALHWQDAYLVYLSPKVLVTSNTDTQEATVLLDAQLSFHAIKTGQGFLSLV